MANFDLISEGDRILVAVSGGKDSYSLLTLLQALRQRAPVHFDLLAVHLDQGQPGHDPAPLADWLRAHGFDHRIVREDTYSIVVNKIPEGRTYCSMCARLRRGILYRLAHQLQCTKIALGHHRDDAVETLLLNLFFAGKLAAIPARLLSDDGASTVIRPLIYCAEETLTRFAESQRFPILPCHLCGSQPDAQRKQMKALLSRLEAEHPNLRQTMLAALGNVNLSHLLDRRAGEVIHHDSGTAPEDTEVRGEDTEPDDSSYTLTYSVYLFVIMGYFLAHDDRRPPKKKNGRAVSVSLSKVEISYDLPGCVTRACEGTIMKANQLEALAGSLTPARDGMRGTNTARRLGDGATGWPSRRRSHFPERGCNRDTPRMSGAVSQPAARATAAPAAGKLRRRNRRASGPAGSAGKLPPVVAAARAGPRHRAAPWSAVAAARAGPRYRAAPWSAVAAARAVPPTGRRLVGGRGGSGRHPGIGRTPGRRTHRRENSIGGGVVGGRGGSGGTPLSGGSVVGGRGVRGVGWDERHAVAAVLQAARDHAMYGFGSQ